MSCRHFADVGAVRPPTLSSRVHREECTLCFAGPASPGGLDVCLLCFNGACAAHSAVHRGKTGHGLAVHIFRAQGDAPAPAPKTPRVSLPGADGTEERASESAGQCCGASRQPGGGSETASNLHESSTSANGKSHACCNGKEGGCSVKSSTNTPKPTATHSAEGDECAVHCTACGAAVDVDERLARVVDEVVRRAPAARERAETEALGAPAPAACEHTAALLDGDRQSTESLPAVPACAECGATENLWLCLRCGRVGCGRPQYDGSGGRGHGAAHASASGHCVSLKLGTIAPEMDAADVHCYACDDARAVGDLRGVLCALGLAEAAAAAPRAATLAELEAAQNAALELRGPCGFLDADGVPMPEAGGVGLANLGNTCYMSSVLQALLRTPGMARSFGPGAWSAHVSSCRRDAAACVPCQLGKLRGALAAEPDAPSSISPWMFRRAVASGHAEFSGSRQQDAAEFVAHLWRSLRRADASAAVAPFAFDVGQSVSCASCGHVVSRSAARDTTELCVNALGDSTGVSAGGQSGSGVFGAEAGSADQSADGVNCTGAADPSAPSNGVQNEQSAGIVTTMERLLQNAFAPAAVDGSAPCPSCGGAARETRSVLLSAPEHLVVTASRIAVSGWVPRKVDASIMGAAEVDLAPFAASSEERPLFYAGCADLTHESATPTPEDDVALAELASMGFPAARARTALAAAGGDVEGATAWLFAHMDDAAGEDAVDGGADAGAVAVLADAGFGTDAARDALARCAGDVERALDWLLNHPPASSPQSPLPDMPASLRYALRAFVAHTGASMHCGHYVAYVRAGEHWRCFNDARVLRTRHPDTAAGYIYVYERVDA